MADFIKVANVADIHPGSMKTVLAGGKRIALANVDGQFFAISDVCSHAQCSLGSEGSLETHVVTCGCHGAQFDVTTGKVMALPAPSDIASYTVKVENGEVFVQV